MQTAFILVRSAMNGNSKNAINLVRERIRYLFREFDNVMVALSASAESTLVLNLVFEIWNSDYKNRRVCAFNIDTEIAHSYSVLHLTRTFERIKDDFDCYWIMLPTKIKHSLFGKEEAFVAWDDSIENCSRPIPALPYVVSLSDNPISGYRYKMPVARLQSSFLKWYRREVGGGKTVCITGARLDEKHNTEKIFTSSRTYRDNIYITSKHPEVWCASPLYDLKVSDVWRAISSLKYEYNEIYDLLYKYGSNPETFRITPPLDRDRLCELRKFAELDGIIWNLLCKRIKNIELYSDYCDPSPLFADSCEDKNEKENKNEKSYL